MEKLKNSGALIGSIIFLVFATAGFIYLWRVSLAQDNIVAPINTVIIRANGISSLKTEAAKILEYRNNLSGMPVTAPAAGQIGRTNPFQ
ncbi:MAG: hypothetical protein NTW50_02790 [Candidatus Berkelbacteria bacterium]|nr:hypothetical protein [Candidatus Berkelbacteria bacterium]